MHYPQTRKNEAQFLALPRLLVAEFDLLLSHLAPLWQQYSRYRRIPDHQEHGGAAPARPS